MKPIAAVPRSRGVIAALATLALVVGSSFGASSAAPDSHPLCGTPWGATRIDGDPVSGRAPTLLIMGNKASGFSSGANRYSSIIRFGEKNALHFGPIASTRMASAGVAQKQEASFFRALEIAASYHSNNDYLVLLDSQFNKLVEFAPQRSGVKR